MCDVLAFGGFDCFILYCIVILQYVQNYYIVVFPLLVLFLFCLFNGSPPPLFAVFIAQLLQTIEYMLTNKLMSAIVVIITTTTALHESFMQCPGLENMLEGKLLF